MRLTAGQISNFEVVLNVLLYVIRSTFIERNLIPGPIIEFRGTGRLMRCYLLSVFERAAILQIGRNSGRAKGMTASGVATVSDVKP